MQLINKLNHIILVDLHHRTAERVQSASSVHLTRRSVKHHSELTTRPHSRTRQLTSSLPLPAPNNSRPSPSKYSFEDSARTRWAASPSSPPNRRPAPSRARCTALIVAAWWAAWRSAHRSPPIHWRTQTGISLRSGFSLPPESQRPRGIRLAAASDNTKLPAKEQANCDRWATRRTLDSNSPPTTLNSIFQGNVLVYHIVFA